MTVSEPMTIELPPAAIEQLVDVLTERVMERLDERFKLEPYMTPKQAAEYLACERHRIYDLVRQGKLTPYKDGSRLLLRRQELDAYLEKSLED